MQMRGDSVMITGGCGDIGMAMAAAFLDEGLRVLLVDLDTARGEAMAKAEPRVTVLRCDLSDPVAMDRDLAPAIGRFRPDILVNNVGASPKYDEKGERLRMWTMTADHWDHVFAVNVRAHFYCTKLCLPHMMEKRAGRVINLGSYAARTAGYRANVHYVASKMAVLGFTKACAKDVAEFGITVNAINPGRIDTQMTRDVPAEVNEAFVKTVPLGRAGIPEDIAKAAVFLASDLADYMTGTAIEVNGGIYVGP